MQKLSIDDVAISRVSVFDLSADEARLQSADF